MATTRFLVRTLQDYYFRPSSPSTTTTTASTTTASGIQAATVTSSHQLFPPLPQNLRPAALLHLLDHHLHTVRRYDARLFGVVLPALHRNAVKLARPPLDSLRAILPEPLQSLVPSFAASASESGGLLHALLPAVLVDRLQAVAGGPLSTGALLATLLAALLPLLFLLARAMEGWRAYLGGGRYSPFGAAAPRGPPPQVTESDYHYIGPDDIVDPPPDTRGNHTYPTGPSDDASAPDVLILRHRGYTYPMHFPAYCIGEGILRVGELRRYAAEKTGTSDPRRIKLLYKGKQLKDDAVAAREEGLKQNSELTCIVSEHRLSHGSSDDSESASDSDFLQTGSPQKSRAYSAAAGAGVAGHGMTAPRVDVDGTLLNDPPKRKKSKKHSSSRRDPSVDERHLNPSKPPAGASTSRPTTPMAANAQPPPPTKTAAAAPSGTSTPKAPLDELGTIANEFHTKWMPLCDKFLASPPTEAKARHQEYTKLSESILAQIIFKLDGVTTDGDDGARKRRKAIIQETQEVLSRLDAIGKPGGK